MKHIYFQLKDDVDIKVRDSFTSLVAKFSSYNKSIMQQDNIFFNSLTPTGSNFLKINSKITAESDFR